MMQSQQIPMTFQRYETKYMLSPIMARKLRKSLPGHLQMDEYGLDTICSLYYDTPDHQLIRRSLEKPVYKEKLRLRSYGPAKETSPIYVELKKKYEGIVYKCRERMILSEAVKITLNKTTATVSGSGAKADGSTITITEKGVYVVSGTLEDGQIIVDASDSDKVQIVLDGVNINCETNAAIYVREADKVFITLAENSSNTLGGGNEYTQIDDNTVDGVIFSKSDLVCNGTGSLTIEADYKHGIVSKDDLVITGGTYKITAADNGITAKDQLKILDGSFDIDAANSAVKAKNTDDTELGNIYIAGGVFTVKAEQDGFHATGSIVVDDGTITVNSGDDGFHAELDTVIRGGTILVEKSNEGLEGKRVVVNGGDITINASDDGINAANSGDDGANAINPGANAAGSGDDDSNAASSNDDSSAVVNSGDDGSISGAADGKEPSQMPPDTENGSDM